LGNEKEWGTTDHDQREWGLNMQKRKKSTAVGKKKQEIANQIEAVLERVYKDEDAYSKGQFYEEEFFFRTDYALVVLNRDNEILISFADHTRPSYAALFTLLMDEIKDVNLLICDDYETDRHGSMVYNEVDGQSTAAVIWEEKERYYDMLKNQVKKVLIRKTKKKTE
jgi:hypothetical protein